LGPHATGAIRNSLTNLVDHLGDARAVLGADLEAEVELVVLHELRHTGLCHAALLEKVSLVAAEDFEGVGRAEILHHGKPLRRIRQRLGLCYVKKYYGADCVAKIASIHAVVALGTHCVPQVQPNADLCWLERRP